METLRWIPLIVWIGALVCGLGTKLESHFVLLAWFASICSAWSVAGGIGMSLGPGASRETVETICLITGPFSGLAVYGLLMWLMLNPREAT